MLAEGTKAPDFALPDQDNNNHKLSDYLGKYVILYFYPKDSTPGCTKEACSFRDNIESLKDKGVVVLGVSADSIESHKNFYKRYNLNFPLLSDTKKEVIKQYEALGEKKLFGKVFEGVLRVSYIIDKKGVILKVYPRVNPLIHAREVLGYIKTAV